MADLLMGVDFGDARTGLAVSDPTGLIAVGAGCVKSPNLRKTAEQVAEKAAELNVKKIIVGHPINMNGTLGPRSERAKAFAECLHEISGIETELFDERLSTVNAYQILNVTETKGRKRRGIIDELSARLILQNYIDKMKNIAAINQDIN